MQVFFDHREERAPLIWQYYFSPERPVDFVPGQYIDLHLNNVVKDPRGAMRTFTLTSLPGEQLLHFIVKIQHQHSQFKEALVALEPGQEAHIDDAMGDLVLPKLASIPLVFIAGGIGVASYASMLQRLLSKREERQIFVFYALRDKREQIFTELLNKYPLSLLQKVIAPNRLTAQQVLDSTPQDALIYISGSQKFVEQLRMAFEQLGTPRSQIVFDYYDGYADL